MFGWLNFWKKKEPETEKSTEEINTNSFRTRYNMHRAANNVINSTGNTTPRIANTSPSSYRREDNSVFPVTFMDTSPLNDVIFKASRGAGSSDYTVSSRNDTDFSTSSSSSSDFSTSSSSSSDFSTSSSSSDP